MRVTQGTFSFLPDLDDEQIEAQLRYALGHGWSILIEHTDDAHPRNPYWELWGQPLFDLEPDQADVALREVDACREAHPDSYVKVGAYDRSLGRQTTALSFIVNRPAQERSFRLVRQERTDRQIGYTIAGRAVTGQTVETTLDVEAVLRESNVERVLAELDQELVGLDAVKTRLREIAAALVIDKLRFDVGLAAERPSLHMAFTGNPGTGKTTVALRMARILHGLGYIEKGHLVSVSRDELVGQYVGHTAPKTKEVLKRAYGGVLFIDEAYYLHRPENERDYGQEAIEILLQLMEADRDKVVVVLAGYKDRMDEFFRSNPGMSSRIAHHLHFPDYTPEQLLAITHLMLEQQAYELSPGAEQVFREYIERRMRRPQFANARSIRNAIDRARLRQASRLFDEGGQLSRSQLMTIESEDLLKSRVFTDKAV